MQKKDLPNNIKENYSQELDKVLDNTFKLALSILTLDMTTKVNI